MTAGDFEFSGFLPGLSSDGATHGHLDLKLPHGEIFRTETTSAGIYRLAAGQRDPQSPHEEDEVYYVLSGSAALEFGEDRIDVGPSTWAFVPALMEHRFVDIAADLTVLVVFSPPHPPRPA
jgi:mannose-6-phosphate isomerase-like protein (cupin superfamily)